MKQNVKKGLLVIMAVFLIGGTVVSATHFLTWDGKGALEDAESIVEKLKNEVAGLDNEVSKLELMVEGLELEKQAIMNERDNLIAQGEADQEEIDRLNDVILVLQGDIEGHLQTINGLKDDVASLKAQLDASQDEVTRLENELRQANADAQEMKTNMCNKVNELPLNYKPIFAEECGLGTAVAYVTNTQELMDALAVNMEVIHLANGVYSLDGITINGFSHLVGESKDGVVLVPSSDMEKLITVAPDRELKLSNLTIDGQGKALKYGVFAEGDLIVNGVNFKNIKQSTYYGFGIGSYATLEVTNSKFENIERIGIHANVGQATIENNIFIGNGEGNRVQYGIDVERGANASVKHNTFSNFSGVASDGSTSAGILATSYFQDFGNTTVQVKNNSFNDSTNGIYIGYVSDKKPTDETIYYGNGNVFNNVENEEVIVRSYQ